MAKNITINNATINAANYEEMSVKELRGICKDRGLTGYSHMAKARLISMLEDDDAAKTAAPVVVIGEAQEIPEDILDSIDGAHAVAPVAQEVTECVVPMIEEPDLSEYADGEKVPACFTDDPVVAPEKESEAKANKERSFKGVAMKDMTVDQLRDKMAADMNEFKFIEDERIRRTKMGNEIISGANKTGGFIDRNLLESIVAKYQYGITGYLILKKNHVVPQEIIDDTQKILSDLLQHWVLVSKVLKVAAIELVERVEGAGCKGKGYRHINCTHPSYKAYKVWQETDPAEWKAVMDSKKYRYIVFQVNVGGSDTTPKAAETVTAKAEVSKEERMAKFMEERNAVWKAACEQFNGMLSIPTGENRTTPYQIQQKVTGLLKINGTWVARVSSQWDTFYAYDTEYKRFYGTDPMKAASYAEGFHHVMKNNKNA